jgi:hypothetical protein
LSDSEIYGYTIDFEKYFNQIYMLINNFQNDIENLKYNIEFQISFIENTPTILLNSIYLDTSNIPNVSHKIKKSDYENLTKILNFNYEINVNIFPYYIVKIIKTNNTIYYNDFYIGKLILLKNIETCEEIEINFDSNALFIYNLNELNDIEEIEPFGFKFFNNKLIIYDGPVFKISKMTDENYIKLDEQIYFIDPISTVNINVFL